MFSRLMKIDRCELVLVDVTPVDKTSAVTQRRPDTQVTWSCVLALHHSVTIYFDVCYTPASRSVAKLSTVIAALVDSASGLRHEVLLVTSFGRTDDAMGRGTCKEIKDAGRLKWRSC